ncbi:MAG: flagellar basal-body MS-ring/collar protein FliF [Pseudomonadota bacterium]
MAEQVQAADQTMMSVPQETGADADPAPKRPAWLEQVEAVTQSKSFRQLGALIGLAALISFAVGFVLWSGKGASGMQPLYAGMAPQEAAQVADALRATGVKFEIDQSTGQIMVPADKLHELRLQLAGQGLPGSPVGFDALHKEPSLGVSQFMETARYQNALENELANTIASLNPVDTARVHLAMPKQSVFVRDRQPATASVVVKLYPGRMLEPAQVQAVVNLVAASVPNMKAADVTVVDQTGRLLSEDIANSGVALNGRQFEYRRRLEQNYTGRVEQLLQPLLGPGRVRAQVNAELDFSEREGTSERYGPSEGKVRSEQLSDQVNTVGNGNALGGVPGALTNQPPGGGTTNPPGGNGIGPQPLLNPDQYMQMLQMPAQSNKTQTRNFEVDRDIQHTKVGPGELKRLTVAVVLDDRIVTKENGEVERKPIADEELAKFTQLVKEAVGFDEARGDRVTVTNVSFSGEELVAETPLYAQPWVWDSAKQLLLGLAALIIFLVIARPLLATLLGEKKKEEPQLGEMAALPPGEQQLALPGVEGEAAGEDSEEAIKAMAHAAAEEEALLAMLPANEGYMQKIEHLRKMIERDPRLVATVIKQWTREDA